MTFKLTTQSMHMVSRETRTSTDAHTLTHADLIFKHMHKHTPTHADLIFKHMHKHILTHAYLVGECGHAELLDGDLLLLVEAAVRRAKVAHAQPLLQQNVLEHNVPD